MGRRKGRPAGAGRSRFIPEAWAPTHRVHVKFPHERQVEAMFVTDEVNGGRRGYTFVDWWSGGSPEFSVTPDGEWRRKGVPFEGRVEVLSGARFRELCAESTWGSAMGSGRARH